MDKSLGTLLRFWGVFQFTQVQPLPSPHKQCWTRVSRIFFRVSTLYRVGGGRTARKFRKECAVSGWPPGCFKREPRNDRKKMNIAVLSQGLLSRIVPVAIAPSCQHPLAKDVRCQLKHVNSKFRENGF